MNLRGIGTLLAIWFSLCALKGLAFFGLNAAAAAGSDLPLLPWHAWTAAMCGYTILKLKVYVPDWEQADFEDYQ